MPSRFAGFTIPLETQACLRWKQDGVPHEGKIENRNGVIYLAVGDREILLDPVIAGELFVMLARRSSAWPVAEAAIMQELARESR